MANPERPTLKVKILGDHPMEYEMDAPTCLKDLGYCSLRCPSFVQADFVELYTQGDREAYMELLGDGVNEFRCEIEDRNKFGTLPLPPKPTN